VHGDVFELGEVFDSDNSYLLDKLNEFLQDVMTVVKGVCTPVPTGFGCPIFEK
jgi:hypothetical protein